jgi:LCP family protein required for cell wall assembly
MSTPPDTTPSARVIAFPEAAIRRRHAPEPRSSRAGAIVLALLAAALVLGLGVLGSAWWAARHIADRVGHIEGAFDFDAATRPVRPAVAGRSLNILVAGLDGERRTAAEHGARSDAVMVLHIGADRRHAWVVSVPRDSWVRVPGRGDHKLNAAYSLGGAALFVQTMEQITGLRMDHLVVLDWTGLRRLTDALGGVPVSLVPPAAALADTAAGDVALEFDGATALPWISERKQLPAGDLDRVKRQQAFARAAFGRLFDRRTLADPAAMRALAAALGDGVRVDTGLSTDELLRLAGSLASLRPEAIVFMTAPTTGTGMEGDASVVYYDGDHGRDLWRAMAEDRMPAFVTSHPQLVTAAHVR